MQIDSLSFELREYLTHALADYVSDNRKGLIDEVLKNRTEYITLVLEDIMDPHNANAVLRTGECLGIQQYHVIENHHPFRIGTGVSKGATKWIDISVYNEGKNNTQEALIALKNKGYRIVVTSPSAEAKAVSDIPLDQKTALLFGNEREGVSEMAKSMADEVVKIPMYGFTESYNISVSAAIMVYQLIHRMQLEVADWMLPSERYNFLKLDWYLKSVNRPSQLYQYFVGQYNKSIS